MKRVYLFAAAALLASAFVVNADDAAAKPKRGGGNPLISALDANHDGVLDEQEITNAPAALRKLDKNGDGKITRAEIRPGAAGQGTAASDDAKPRKNKNKNK
jgi:hypothetical protein